MTFDEWIRTEHSNHNWDRLPFTYEIAKSAWEAAILQARLEKKEKSND